MSITSRVIEFSGSYQLIKINTQKSPNLSKCGCLTEIQKIKKTAKPFYEILTFFSDHK
jgi:hypothetical protein